MEADSLAEQEDNPRMTPSDQPGSSSTTPPPTEEIDETPAAVDSMLEGQTVLLLGTLGGGGIHHYLESIEDHLEGTVDVKLYDMYSEPTGSGVGWFMKSFIRSVAAFMRFPFQRRPDIVHAHASQDFSFYRVVPYVLFISLFWRRPVILHVHGSSFDQFVLQPGRLAKLLQTITFAHTDHIIVLSEYWKEVLRSAGYDSSISTVPNAVEVDTYDPQYEADVPHVVFVSNLITRKGIIEFLEVIDQLDQELEQPYRASIAGIGPHEHEVEELANRIDAVRYLGRISEGRKRELMSEGTIFVLPTYAEGLPFALLEGMAGGNAIVTTPVGSIPEVIDGDGGVFVEPGDPDSLLRELRLLLCSPSQVTEMGRYNRELVERAYSWDSVTDLILTSYARVGHQGDS